MLIGQKHNREIIDTWFEKNTFPNFILIIGEKGSGKKTLRNYILSKMDIQIVNVTDNSISSIRDAIDLAINLNTEAIITFTDIDSMTVGAKNAMLKITEEPPKGIKFILTAESEFNIPSTLISRSVVLKMQPYTLDELKNFTTESSILEIATTPLMCKEFTVEQAKELYSVCKNLVLSMLYRAPGSVIMQSTELLHNKTDDNKINCEIAWSVIKRLLYIYMQIFDIDMGTV